MCQAMLAHEVSDSKASGKDHLIASKRCVLVAGGKGSGIAAVLRTAHGMHWSSGAARMPDPCPCVALLAALCTSHLWDQEP